MQEHREIDNEFAAISSAVELRKAVQGFKSKMSVANERNSNKENEPYQANQMKDMNFYSKISVSSPIPKKDDQVDNFKFDVRSSNLFMTVKTLNFNQVFSHNHLSPSRLILLLKTAQRYLLKRRHCC